MGICFGRSYNSFHNRALKCRNTRPSPDRTPHPTWDLPETTVFDLRQRNGHQWMTVRRRILNSPARRPIEALHPPRQTRPRDPSGARRPGRTGTNQASRSQFFRNAPNRLADRCYTRAISKSSHPPRRSTPREPAHARPGSQRARSSPPLRNPYRGAPPSTKDEAGTRAAVHVPTKATRHGKPRHENPVVLPRDALISPAPRAANITHDLTGDKHQPPEKTSGTRKFIQTSLGIPRVVARRISLGKRCDP